MTEHESTTPAAEPASGPALTGIDRDHLARLEQKAQLVRDLVRAVASRRSTGLYLHGRGGIGKSYTVLTELERLGADYELFNSHMTALGLFEQLERRPDAVHVLEDMEPLLTNPAAQGVFRSALWGQRRDGDDGPMERTVTWSSHRRQRSFVFTGGIVVLANVPLGDLPQLAALRTRIDVHHFEATDAEVRALMRMQAAKGYEADGRRLDPAACGEVCEHLIGQARGAHQPLDLRLLVKGFEARLQWEAGEAGCHWQDLLAATARGRAAHFRHPVDVRPAAERRRQELDLVRELDGVRDRHARLRIWQERTGGKSQATLYRRLKDCGG